MKNCVWKFVYENRVCSQWSKNNELMIWSAVCLSVIKRFFTKIMHRSTSRWKRSWNWTIYDSICFLILHIHQIWPHLTSICLPISKRCYRKIDSTAIIRVAEAYFAGKSFYKKGIASLERWNDCIAMDGDYVNK